MPLHGDGYLLLADAVLAVHAAFVLFVIGGQALVLAGWMRRWRWVCNPVFRLSHLGAIGFVVAEAWFGASCPLTVLENALRARAGLEAGRASFIGYWIHELLFYDAPAWVFTLVYSLFAALVLASFVAFPPRSAHGAGKAPEEAGRP